MEVRTLNDQGDPKATRALPASEAGTASEMRIETPGMYPMLLEPLRPRAIRVTLGKPSHPSRLEINQPLAWNDTSGHSASAGELRVLVQPAPLSLTWTLVSGNQTYALVQDHPDIAYRFTPRGIRHTRVQAQAERSFGLGEVSGPLSRISRHYRLNPRDACNYDAEMSDPLYKHWPVSLTRHPSGAWSALIYDQPHPMQFDYGCERHHYYHFFTYTEVEEAEYLRYALVAAPDLPILLTELTAVLGKPALPPRWSLGYLASGMAYTDAPDPAAALLKFARGVRELDIPCDALHLSSGYSLHGGKRYVFRWNRETIPDPNALVANLRTQGIRMIANIKPALLKDHPNYDELEQTGAFVRDSSGSSLEGDFWGGPASWLDFTNPLARTWWKEKVKHEVLERGIEGIWNDNNEFALEVESFKGNGDRSYPSEQIYGMATASYAAQLEHAQQNDIRPFLISRSASLGVQRLAQTWSGDNASLWKTLRYNTPMGLSMGLSGYANIGHDVGGFYGDPPGGELLLRWVQQAIAYPRFSIHSWKDDPTEPWSYPEVTAAIREAIRLRYRLIPYIYSLFWEHTQSGAPIQRPLVFEFSQYLDDPGFHALLGPFLLLPSVPDSGVRELEISLPGVWIDWHTGLRYQGESRIPAPLEQTPLLAREGAIIPLGPVMPWIELQFDNVREVLVYPHSHEGISRFTLYEDDGESLAYQKGSFRLLHFTLTSSNYELHLEVQATGEWPLPYPKLEVRLAVPDVRPLRVSSNWTILEHLSNSATLSTQQ